MESLYMQELLAPRWLNLAPRWFKVASQRYILHPNGYVQGQIGGIVVASETRSRATLGLTPVTIPSI